MAERSLVVFDDGGDDNTTWFKDIHCAQQVRYKSWSPSEPKPLAHQPSHSPPWPGLHQPYENESSFQFKNSRAWGWLKIVHRESRARQPVEKHLSLLKLWYVTICYHMLPNVIICYLICYHRLPSVTICYHDSLCGAWDSEGHNQKMPKHAKTCQNSYARTGCSFNQSCPGRSWTKHQE